MSKILNQLISEFESREERGFKKYGTTMDRTDLKFSEWLQHFKEELMDGLLYLQKIQMGFLVKYSFSLCKQLVYFEEEIRLDFSFQL